MWCTSASPRTFLRSRSASQIDVLNEDFAGRNLDVNSAPSVWREAVGDARIVFKLADRDPDGAVTNGITRTATRIAAFGDDDAVKSAATGGADAWPADRYLNIWVCHLRGPPGLCPVPGGSRANRWRGDRLPSLRDQGTAEAPFDLGRTATHEVGHWLNLFHIWGDDGTGCAGTDQVDDTPNQAGPNTGFRASPT